ncbi:hypothetical protein [Echinicola shivajiensis]|uniref:hypothetical protein n=1 Tax=Echinicola shivajiensis TaxID=1035916 RepID=UPI001BFC4C08|nr:hypothetical protein [Echinicola shivajiensis]
MIFKEHSPQGEKCREPWASLCRPGYRGVKILSISSQKWLRSILPVANAMDHKWWFSKYVIVNQVKGAFSRNMH